jgi:hypothetical protein
VAVHLRYEVAMLLSTAQGLASGILRESPAHNALVESFAVHARNVIDFLWRNSSNDDDVLAEDFFPSPDLWHGRRPQMPSLLETAKQRAHKQVAHLTYTRVLLSEQEKEWQFVEIAQQLQQVFAHFLRAAPHESIGPLLQRGTNEG